MTLIFQMNNLKIQIRSFEFSDKLHAVCRGLASPSHTIDLWTPKWSLRIQTMALMVLVQMTVYKLEYNEPTSSFTVL